jgi:hypothetical protein
MSGKTGESHPNSKKVQQFKDGIFINEFGSMREAERMTGICNVRISEACKNGKIVNGYSWITI